jgi:C1A family cysteine protease
MMKEILERGPIACSLAVTKEFKNYSHGIFNDTSNAKKHTHAVSIIAWGEEKGVKYWLARNSWGSYWVIKLLLNFF